MIHEKEILLMIIHIDYCEYDTNPHWRINAYTVEIPGDENVRDANVAEQMVRALVGLSEEDPDKEFLVYGQPGADADTYFRISIVVRNTHRGRSDYQIAYRQIKPAPLEVVRAAMECYHDIKRNIKKARKTK